MNFIYVIQLMCWNYLIDLITDNRNRNSKNRSNSGDGNNKGGARVNAVVSVVQFDQNLDQTPDQKVDFFRQVASKRCTFG